MPACCLLAPLVLCPLILDTADVQPLLEKPIVGPRQAMLDVQEFCAPRIPRLPEVKSPDEWRRLAENWRQEALARAVYRGEAAGWRDAPGRVEWLETIEGGPGYRIRKLRYEALPGLWIPALLYEPEKLSGQVPVYMAVNGHEPVGKAAPYKQVRCINLAKRGIIVLNPEWLGMGQLRQPGYAHGRMNQLDLCGTSGLAPFYLSMKRGLDLLLEHPHADPERVGVSGLSGGGWQTIIISALDTRVKLCNPVAGYSSFRTRLQHHKDLGDSEQTPADLGMVVDYTHLTAMLAPRATLLTYNAKDECCFEAGYALPPLEQAARPVFKLLEREHALRTHVNHDPGTHNYLRENREAFYRLVGDFFYVGGVFDPKEIPSDMEIKSSEQLAVDLPQNTDFNKLALMLSRTLPRDADWPTEREQAARYQDRLRERLRNTVKFHEQAVEATQLGSEQKGSLNVTWWKLRVGGAWSVPCVELVQGKPQRTALVIADGGRRTTTATTLKLFQEGYRVLAVDPWYFGESSIESRAYLFALMIGTVGERPLGIQSGQVAAIARWSQSTGGQPVTVMATGPRASLIALVAAAVEPKAIAGVELHDSLGSLKEILEQNRSYEQLPEAFCPGLLEVCDIKQLAGLVAPRPLTFHKPTERVKKELGVLKHWYTLLGKPWEPWTE